MSVKRSGGASGVPGETTIKQPPKNEEKPTDVKVGRVAQLVGAIQSTRIDSQRPLPVTQPGKSGGLPPKKVVRDIRKGDEKKAAVKPGTEAKGQGTVQARVRAFQGDSRPPQLGHAVPKPLPKAPASKSADIHLSNTVQDKIRSFQQSGLPQNNLVSAVATEHVRLPLGSQKVSQNRPLPNLSRPSVTTQQTSPSARLLCEKAALKGGSPALKNLYRDFTIVASEKNPDEKALAEIIYHMGRALKNDDTLLFQLYSAAATKGHPKAAFYAGRMLELGVGTQKNMEKASDFYKQAVLKLTPVAKTDPEAAFLLGMMYEEGKGCKNNPSLAQSYVRFAAEKGHSGATCWSLFQKIEQLYNQSLSDQEMLREMCAHFIKMRGDELLRGIANNDISSLLTVVVLDPIFEGVEQATTLMEAKLMMVDEGEKIKVLLFDNEKEALKKLSIDHKEYMRLMSTLKDKFGASEEELSLFRLHNSLKNSPVFSIDREKIEEYKDRFNEEAKKARAVKGIFAAQILDKVASSLQEGEGLDKEALRELTLFL